MEVLSHGVAMTRVTSHEYSVFYPSFQELAHQGEQLRNVDRKLDNINTDLKVSQKHLNSMKSIFGSIRSYFRGGSNADASRNAAPGADVEERSPTELEKTLDKVKQEGPASRPSTTHPAFRVRGLDTSGFGAGFEDDRGDFSAPPPQQPPYKSRTAEIEQKLDSNLAELDSGLGRLKFLAQGLGKELEDQNELLDHLTDKTDMAEGTVVHQNSQIRRILKK
ncbi:hypothetical protein HPB48_017921 [Haemaphysalis longicornis]|uniref:t-SNARE coiled-coil homology domain-containing protein n=1 Tax=Haemaphysalis longicornis TaxID=44386 RepID=A0A9J6GNH8_HAELO|nr:hypothetical protein HPB48_017921 [Haemaphysalis longicornis]